MPRRDPMPRPRSVDWRHLEQTTCKNKVAYPTRADAEIGRCRDPKMHVYPCPWTRGHWHVGHRLSMRSLRSLAYALRARQLDHSDDAKAS